MRIAVTLVASPGGLDPAIVADVCEALNADASTPASVTWLSKDRAADIVVEVGDQSVAHSRLETALHNAPIDRCLQFDDRRRKRLLVADMDSTILANETLDEISAEAGVGDIVADITARSMRGELNFEESLRQRVALLDGRDATIIDRVLERIQLNPGAPDLVATMRRHGAVTALISGGFTMFTDRVQHWLGFGVAKANDFEIKDGRLTGRLMGAIVGRETKLEWLRNLCDQHALDDHDALTIGDGANDLAMITAAGLGVAYHGKPVLREAAAARIDHTDLRTALYFQGYRDDEIVTA